eukprot:TRINITY_DN7385_c0_g1_i2.p1 TRINITY_DN7385_c0_g1~~TRINITY_DN7385_c0_g1_i2.p1  ORF type:complete len:328 (-),score=38.32 TRINITY_DN7385_c0_g1_i2:19-1002(-)
MLKLQRTLSSLGLTRLSGSVVPIIACLCYAITSMMMTLVNKTLVSRTFYGFPSSELLILYQNSFAILLVLSSAVLGQVEIKWKWSLAKRWIPINIIFLLMLITGQVSLAYLSVAMVTIFKNFSTIGTTIGDWLIQGNPLTPLIFSSLIVMFSGSVAAGIFDLEFSKDGYLWMGANCVLTAAYVLSSKIVLGSVSSTDAALYNNTFSIPILILWLLYQNRFPEILSAEALNYTGFWVLLFISGVTGTAISLSTFWALKATSPTTYAVVGSLNKIPLTIIGTFLFGSKINLSGWVSIVIGLGGGVLYSIAKIQQQTKQREEEARKEDQV